MKLLEYYDESGTNHLPQHFNLRATLPPIYTFIGFYRLIPALNTTDVYDAVASLEQNERDHHVPTFVSTERKG